MKKFKTPRRINIFKITLITTMCMLVTGFALQLIFSNELAIKGSEMTKLNNNKAILEEDISRLEYESANISSLAYVEKEARQIGFVDMTQPLITIKTPVVASAKTLILP